MTTIRKMTRDGIDLFRRSLQSLRDGETINVSPDLFAASQLSEIVIPLVQVEPRTFATKREAAEYLIGALEPLTNTTDVMGDMGLWSWLAAFYFSSICPDTGRGRRKVLADPHYILEPADYKRRYRHLLATPYRIRLEMPDHNRIFLDAPLSIHGDLIEQTMSKLYLLRYPAVREIIDRLYYDERLKRPKRGILPQKRAMKQGDLRNRLPLRVAQLQRTYDVAGLDSDQLLRLLGPEFDRWKR